MTSEERIITLHPVEGKKGVNISRQKYDQIREAIIEILDQEDQLTFEELRSAIEAKMKGSFEGSISWYYTTVKLDLEARGIVVRIGKTSPQRLQLHDPYFGS